MQLNFVQLKEFTHQLVLLTEKGNNKNASADSFYGASGIHEKGRRVYLHTSDHQNDGSSGTAPCSKVSSPWRQNFRILNKVGLVLVLFWRFPFSKNKIV